MLLVILEFLVKDKQRNDVEIIKDLKIKHIYITIMEFNCHETKKKKIITASKKISREIIFFVIPFQMKVCCINTEELYNN